MDSPPSKVIAITNYPPLSSTKSLQSFLGMTNFAMCFISNLAAIVYPLRELLKKGVPFRWTAQCESSFNKLKATLQEATLLAHPDFSKPFRLQTDASNLGLGAVLLQQNINAQWQPIAFISRSLTSAQKNYSTTEKELLSIVWAFSKFHPYLHRSSVQVETDHQPLVALLKNHHPPGRLLRWTLALQEYTFTLIYCRGSHNLIADGLSRTEFQAAQFFPTVVDLPLESSQMATLQQQDPHLRELSTQLRSTVTNTAHQQFMLIDHVLHYISKQGKPRIYVPTQLRQTYLEFYHNHPLSGHLGFHKVLEKIRLHYYWPQMHKSVTEHILMCLICQQTKTLTRNVEFLNPISLPPMGPHGFFF